MEDLESELGKAKREMEDLESELGKAKREMEKLRRREIEEDCGALSDEKPQESEGEISQAVADEIINQEILLTYYKVKEYTPRTYATHVKRANKDEVLTCVSCKKKYASPNGFSTHVISNKRSCSNGICEAF